VHRGKIDFVHIGYHKTGTTYLQNCGLKKHSQIKMLADYNDDNNEFEQTLFQLKCDITEEHEYLFSADRVRTKFFETCSEIADLERDDQVIGISDEAFSGDYLSGRDSYLFAQRIHDVFGTVKIVMVVRNQSRMIDSIYRQYIHMGGTLSLKKVLDPIRFPTADLFNKLKYDKLVAHYYTVFGKENVLVVPFELINNKPEFLGEIYRFLGVNEKEIPECLDEVYNKSHHFFTLYLDRIINIMFNNTYSAALLGDWFFKRKFHAPVLTRSKGWIWLNSNLGWWYRRVFIERFFDPHIMYPLFKNRTVLGKNVKQIVQQEFSNSNRKLEELIDHDLGALGYPVGEKIE